MATKNTERENWADLGIVGFLLQRISIMELNNDCTLVGRGGVVVDVERSLYAVVVKVFDIVVVQETVGICEVRR